MAGASLQLIAEATENNYLTGNPQITFFKSVFRRHTNFAIESRKLNFSSKPNFGDDVNCRIPRGPDLLYKLYLYVELPEISVTISQNEYKAFRWLNWLGHSLVKNSKISIGQTEIDEQDGEWLHIWNELSQKEGKKSAYAEMIGNTPELTQIHSVKGISSTDQTITLIDSKNLYIPLQFWFCKNPGQALPIIALEKSDIMVDIEFEKLEELIWASHQNTSEIRHKSKTDIFSPKPSLKNAYIYADYVYLDSDERKRFLNNRHEYLIEKVQTRGTSLTTPNNTTHKVELNFSNPVKELIWRIRPTSFVNKKFCQCRGGMQRYNYTDSYDFSGFSGTPEPKGGPGMPGGRTNTNFFYSLPSVNLQYDASTFVPKYNSFSFTNNSNWDGNDINVALTHTDKTKTGYDYIEKYHYNDNTNTKTTTNLYKNKTLKNVMGIENSTISNRMGIWSNPSDTNMMVTDNGDNPTSKASIFLNGVRRFDEREGFYFNVIQPYQHHTNVPCNGLNVYSFAIDPEDHQPSGACNFSNISDAEIIINLSTNVQAVVSEVKVYALTYNILRIENKKAEIAFSR
jgi:hypothetical protein